MLSEWCEVFDIDTSLWLTSDGSVAGSMLSSVSEATADCNQHNLKEYKSEEQNCTSVIIFSSSLSSSQ